APELGAKPCGNHRKLKEARLRHDDLIAWTREHAAHDVEQLFRPIAADDALRLERKLLADGAAQIGARGIGIAVGIAQPRPGRDLGFSRQTIGTFIEGTLNEHLTLSASSD